MRTLCLGLSLLLLTACSHGQKRSTNELRTHLDSVAYAVGLEIAGSFKETPLEKADMDILLAGLRDGLGDQRRLDEEEVVRVMTAFNRTIQEERMAQEHARGEEARAAGEKYLAENGKRNGVVTTASGLQYEVVTLGTGPKPKETDKVKVHYTGTLIDGTKFDSSKDRGVPAEFPVRGVIRGWIEGLQLMPVGSSFKFTIPQDLAYGPGGAAGGKIPPYATLLFDVELLEIVP